MSVLFVAAVQEETAALPDNVEIVHVGVGKVAAAVELAWVLASRDDISLVVNVGTAGGLKHQPVGEVVEVAHVSQHDLNHAGIEALVGRPQPGGPLTLPGPEGAAGRLVTGDRLVANGADRDRLGANAEVVDMEGYALAAVCARFGVPIWMAKAVSDSADESAARSWHSALTICAESLAKWAESRGLSNDSAA